MCGASVPPDAAVPVHRGQRGRGRQSHAGVRPLLRARARRRAASGRHRRRLGAHWTLAADGWYVHEATYMLILSRYSHVFGLSEVGANCLVNENITR